jgi:hypothetical protein
MPKSKCPTCGSAVKKQTYTKQIEKKRMSYSKEALLLIDTSVETVNSSRDLKLTDSDIYGFLSEIDNCDNDMVIMSINNYLKSNAPKEGKGLKYLSAIIINNNSSKSARKRHEYLSMDRIPPKID